MRCFLGRSGGKGIEGTTRGKGCSMYRFRGSTKVSLKQKMTLSIARTKRQGGKGRKPKKGTRATREKGRRERPRR